MFSRIKILSFNGVNIKGEIVYKKSIINNSIFQDNETIIFINEEKLYLGTL